MCRVILMRHGEPELPQEKTFIGVTDVPLSDAGRKQAKITGRWIAEHEGDAVEAVYSSPLSRCRDTAEAVTGAMERSGRGAESGKGSAFFEIRIQEGLREIHLGSWENHTFREVREKYPEEFDKRGRDLDHYVISGGESFVQASIRFEKTIEQIKARHPGKTIVVVTHAGVIRAYLGRMTGSTMQEMMQVPMPYAGMTILEQENDIPEHRDRPGEKKTWQVVRTGFLPEEVLTPERIRALYQKYGTPDKVQRHMAAVRDAALDIMDEIGESDQEVLARMEKAALLHDLCRFEKNHALVSAEAVRKEGFDRIADLIAEHHSVDENPGEELTEEEILYYADKIVREDRRVTLEERFAGSREKCRTEEAWEAFQKRYHKAVRIREKIRRQSEQQGIDKGGIK